MNTLELEKDKLKIINWVSQLQDQSLVEKIKSLMQHSRAYTLTEKQQNLLDKQLGSDKSLYKDAEDVYDRLKNKHGL